jgi:hypothetical protein
MEAKSESVADREGRLSITRRLTLRRNPQEQAVEALGKIGDSAAVPALIREVHLRIAALRTTPIEANRQSMRQRFAADFSDRYLLRSIDALTGLTRSNTDLIEGDAWRFGDYTLPDACLRFLNATAISSDRTDSRQAIRQLLLVCSESEVEQALSQSIGSMSTKSLVLGPSRANELIELLRPTLSPKSEYRALLQALVRRKREPETDWEIYRLLIHRLLIERAKQSAKERSQVFDALAEEIERDSGSELIAFVDALVALGVPDPDHTKRIAAALEKAQDVELPWKKEAVDRGLEHLKTK